MKPRRRIRDASAFRGAGNTVSRYRVPVGSVIEVKVTGRRYVVIEDLTYVGQNNRGQIKHVRSVRAAPIINGTPLWRASVFVDDVFEVTGETMDTSEHEKRTSGEPPEDIPTYNLRLG